MEKLDVKRPRKIGRIAKVADIDAVLRTTLPWRITNFDILLLFLGEAILKFMNVKILGRLGF